MVHVDHLKPFIGRKHPRNWLTEPQEVVEPRQEPAPGNNLPSDQEHEGSGGTYNEIPVQIRSRRERMVKPREVYSPE